MALSVPVVDCPISLSCSSPPASPRRASPSPRPFSPVVGTHLAEAVSAAPLKEHAYKCAALQRGGLSPRPDRTNPHPPSAAAAARSKGPSKGVQSLMIGDDLELEGDFDDDGARHVHGELSMQANMSVSPFIHQRTGACVVT